jgi:hypothetical protein
VTVRGYFYELVKIVSGLNADVDVQYGSVDIRVEYTGKCICRIVPYRELIHLHIGESPVWEVRVRDEAAYLEAVDRILDVYLAIVAEASRPAKRYATTSYPGR